MIRIVFRLGGARLGGRCGRLAWCPASCCQADCSFGRLSTIEGRRLLAVVVRVLLFWACLMRCILVLVMRRRGVLQAIVAAIRLLGCGDRQLVLGLRGPLRKRIRCLLVVWLA